MQPSRRARSIPSSVVFAIDARVRELAAAGEDVIGLGAGQPDFPSPPGALEAATRFLEGGRVGYTPAAGLPELREAAAAHLGAICGVPFEREQVVVTDGAKEALSLAMAAIADPGDEIVVPLPAWLSYEPMATQASLKAVTVGTGADFKLTPEGLEAALTERTRAVVLNSPSNPTGAVFTRDELEALAAVLRERDVWVLSDEIYWCFVFDGEHVSMAGLPGMAERTIVVNGLSKSHAMTGWRVGFLAAPRPVAAAVASLKSHMTSNTAAPSQHAALGALAGGDEHTTMMGAAFRRRRDATVAGLTAIPGLSLTPPAGAFYVFPRIDGLYREGLDDSVGFCKALLDAQRLAAVPGAAFGEDRCLRLSIAASDEQLAEGVARLAAFVEDLRG